METYLSFIIRASLSLVLFYICYKTFLANETFFRFNRVVIIAGIASCLCISFFDFKIGQNVGDATIESLFQAKNNIYDMKEIQLFPWGTIIYIVYFIGVAISSILLIRTFLSLIRILKNNEKINHKGFFLILTDKSIAPFSWGRYIVMSGTDYEENPEEIISHEAEHIRKKHSFDIMFIEILSLLFWFNPVIWLLKREMRDIHEYQADRGVLKSGINASKYQLLLIKKAVGSSSYTLANSFNHSKIKKRITMMLKRKSNRWAKVKLLCLIPAGLAPAIIFAQPKVNQALAEVTQTAKISDLFDSDKTEKDTLEMDEVALIAVYAGDTLPSTKTTVEYVKPQAKKDGDKRPEKKEVVKFKPPVIKEDKAPSPSTKGTDRKSVV